MAHVSEGARDAWRIPQPHSSFDDTKKFVWRLSHCFGKRSSSPSSGTSSRALSGREKGAEGASGASAPLWENSTVYNRSSIRVC